MRSFLMRFVDEYQNGGDFRDIPIAKFTWPSFLVVVIVFLSTHAMWQWWVMLPWAVLTNLWFYYRRDLMALIVLHGATNGTILAGVLLLNGRFDDGGGNPLDLMFLG